MKMASRHNRREEEKKKGGGKIPENFFLSLFPGNQTKN